MSSGHSSRKAAAVASPSQGREFFIDNLLVRIHFIIARTRSIGLAPWEFEIPFSSSLTPAFLAPAKPPQLPAVRALANRLFLSDRLVVGCVGIRIRSVQGRGGNNEDFIPIRGLRRGCQPLPKMPRQIAASLDMRYHTYLTEGVYKFVLQKSVPAQIRLLILFIGNDKG